MNAKSQFAFTLTLLMDGSKLCERKQWAEILGVSEAAISQWLNDKTLPSPEFVRMILSTVKRNANRVPKGIIEQFERTASKPAADVTPFGRRVGRSIDAYIVKPLLDDFRRVFESLDPESQERLLLRFTEACLEEAGALKVDSYASLNSTEGGETKASACGATGPG
jgi:transcriptional regulator with XRE-family HTH domain